MITFKGINHVALVTRDMDGTIRFWRDLLGMRLIAAMGRPGYRHYFLEVSQSDMVAFFEWPEVEPALDKDPGVPVKGPFAFDHVALGVECQDDLWELKNRLSAAGFWVSEVVDHGFIYSLYSFDPNNIAVEFTYNVPGRDIRSQPLFTDVSPCKTAQEGPEKQPGMWNETAEMETQEARVVYPGEGSELFS
jgi:catechol 2,3-dioxygenase-like lactoylglutathione lyase family enzyme